MFFDALALDGRDLRALALQARKECLALLVPGRSTLTDDVKTAIGRPHVSFKVCEIAMRNQKVDKSQLLSNVVIVPDGIGEIVARQKEGWGYIKAVAH